VPARLTPRRAHLPAAVLGLGIAAAACAPSSSGRSPLPSSPPHRATPTPGIANTVAFTLVIPPGWSDLTGDPSVAGIHPSGPVFVVLAMPPQAPVVHGVNDVEGIIVVTQVSQPLAEPQVVQYLQSVRAAGATDVTPPVPAMVGGSAATSITYTSAQDGTPVQTEDVVVAHGGAMYEVELITSRHSFSAQAKALDDILSRGWTWVRGD
jgi:hypothetical protein